MSERERGREGRREGGRERGREGGREGGRERKFYPELSHRHRAHIFIAVLSDLKSLLI